MLLVGTDPLMLATLLATMVVGFTVHEFAHAWTAYRLGDRTAYLQGRLTLDPRSHIDPLGALMMILAGFGWARPVPFDPLILGRRGVTWVALAGPASNLALAALAGLVYRSKLLASSELLASVVLTFASLNVLLAVFNMLPLAPLDGWKVLLGLVPGSLAYRLQPLEVYGGMILLLLIVAGQVAGTSLLWTIMDPFYQFLMALLVGGGLRT